MDADQGLSALRGIKLDWAALEKRIGEPNEAETRLNLIDRQIREVLGWPLASIRLEQQIHEGYADYVLRTHRSILIVEAKKVGVSFALPAGERRMLKISGALWSDENVRKALRQVQQYCSDEGVPFGAISNGIQWAIFRAVDPLRSWKEGSAFLIRSLDDFEANFTEIWNTLSYPAVQKSALELKFKDTGDIRRPLGRPIDAVRNPSDLFGRNSLHLQIAPLIDRVFRDITENEEALQQCYVASRHTTSATDQLKVVFHDTVPSFAKSDNTAQITDGKGIFRDKIEELVKSENTPTTILIMGGIGAGKTTFLARFFNQEERNFIDRFCIWFYLDFRTAPPDGSIEEYTYEKAIEHLRSMNADLGIDQWGTFEKIFKDDIASLAAGILHGLSEEMFKERLRKYVEEWIRDKKFYLKRLLTYIQKNRGKTIAFVIDNLDQAAFEYQQKLFLLAHHIAQEFSCIVLVSLREETYFTSSRVGAFNAYHNLRYHLSSPDFERVMRARLDYGVSLLKLSQSEMKKRLQTQTEFDQLKLTQFFEIVSRSFFNKNKIILQCVRALSGGDTRKALDMCNSFMLSGYAEVAKMLRIHTETGQYTIAFHEFSKALIFGDHRYYRESRSEIPNLFDLSGESNASHLTAMRILRALVGKCHAANRHGEGFITISSLVSDLSELFGNEQDIVDTLGKLLLSKLIETETQEPRIDTATHVRVTQAGDFLANYFARIFVYLDSVQMDTPIRDANTLAQLKRVAETSSLEERLTRTSLFLKYLEAEEEQELGLIPTNLRSSWEFIPKIRQSVEQNEYPKIRQSAKRRPAEIVAEPFNPIRIRQEE